jgi:alkaline phosphatase D
MEADRVVFEYWWQDQLTPNSPDVLGYQMVSWAQDDASGAVPKYRDQIDSVTAQGLTVAATSGTRAAAPAPEGALVLA